MRGGDIHPGVCLSEWDAPASDEREAPETFSPADREDWARGIPVNSNKYWAVGEGLHGEDIWMRKSWADGHGWTAEEVQVENNEAKQEMNKCSSAGNAETTDTVNTHRRGKHYSCTSCDHCLDEWV